MIIALLNVFVQDKTPCDPKAWECIETNYHNKFGCAVTCEGIYADVQVASFGEEEKKDDKEKVYELIRQYNEYKRKALPNFRFNPQKETTHYGMTRFQLILQVRKHNVTKNLTGHRMQVEVPQIYQMKAPYQKNFNGKIFRG